MGVDQSLNTLHSPPHVRGQQPHQPTANQPHQPRTSLDNRHPTGALNDTLSWTTIRPLGVLPLDTRCRPSDLRFEDGEAATGPPLNPKMWGACNTVRRLNGQDVCSSGKTPGACPSLEGPIYGALGVLVQAWVGGLLVQL